MMIFTYLNPQTMGILKLNISHVSNYKRVFLLIACVFIFGDAADENGEITMSKRGMLSDFKISLRKFILQMIQNSESVIICEIYKPSIY